MPKWAHTCEKILSQVGLEPEYQDYMEDALPVELKQLMILHKWGANCMQNAAMRFTANENVALLAITTTT